MEKRIEREMQLYPEFQWKVVDKNVWNVGFLGPPETPWENTTVWLEIKYSSTYPFRCPDYRIISPSPIFHPNIHPDGCPLSNLMTGSWSPLCTIVSIKDEVVNLLKNPHPHPSYGNEASKIFQESPEKYFAILSDVLSRKTDPGSL